jgi:chemotaxis protein methyltransferase CheR
MCNPVFNPQPARPFHTPPIVQPAAKQGVSVFDEALALYAQGLYTDAAAKLTKLLTNGDGLDNNPPFGNAAALLARTLANQGDFTAALEWSGKAVAVNKLDPEIRYLQAIIFQEQGEIDAAVAALKQTLYLDQTFVLAHFALANLFLGSGKIKEAVKHLKNAAALLVSYGDDDMLPGSEGMSSRRFSEIIAETMAKVVA